MNPSPTQGHDAPLVTFALFAYNQEAYVAEAVRGALAQTYSPLEIILSDDCSTDRTFEVMREMADAYAGPHKIRLNRNPTNLGLAGHVNVIFELAQGELIVAAAGDDISLPHRTRRAVDVWGQRHREPILLHSSVVRMDRVGTELGIWRPPIGNEPIAMKDLATAVGIYIGATGVWSASLYQRFGPIRFPMAYEDLVLGFRAALASAIVFIDEPLVKYRESVGLSSAPTWMRFGRGRRVQNATMIDVLRQRISDVRQTLTIDSEELLQVLSRELSIRSARHLFYASPPRLLAGIFSPKAPAVFTALRQELSFLSSCGLAKVRSWMARKC